MGNRRHRRTLRHNEEKDGEVKRLKGIIRRLESDKRKLLSELKTLEDAFDKSITHIKGKVDKTSIEDVIKSVNKGQKLHNVLPVKETKDWTCHKCKNGSLCFIEINRHDFDFFIRKCDNKECKYMTRLKRLTLDTDRSGEKVKK